VPRPDDTLITRALGALLGVVPAGLRIADAGGRLVGLDGDGGESTRPSTLRELWERERPTRPGAAEPLPFLDTPAIRALGGVTVTGETVELIEASGVRVVEASATPIRDEGNDVVGVLLFQQDVTVRGRLEAALGDAERRERLLQQQLDELQEMRIASLGRLASGVMHDMNNALNPIMAAAYLLQHHANAPDTVREYAERIRVAAENGAALSSRVGRFVRQDPVHAGGDEAIDLSALVADVVNGFEPLQVARARVGTGVSVAVESGTAVRTRGLPVEIRVALENLIRNALIAMPDGGMLTLRTGVEGEHACVAVQDSGAGMDASTRARAFEPFFTTHRSGSAGLGLAEVFGIMRRHRGSASIESAPAEGTTVTLRFPVDATAGEAGIARATIAAGGPLHVLLVEDDDDGRDFLCRVLRAAGHTVDAARDCAEARERLAAAAATSYHLMLTDVGLPDGNGWELASLVHARWPETRIGVITGWDATADGHEASGAEFVLRKPVRGAELLANIAGRKTSTTTE
jgi:signal transduction histidine kinase/ActR/RegA family two-component response regulator